MYIVNEVEMIISLLNSFHERVSLPRSSDFVLNLESYLFYSVVVLSVKQKKEKGSTVALKKRVVQKALLYDTGEAMTKESLAPPGIEPLTY